MKDYRKLFIRWHFYVVRNHTVEFLDRIRVSWKSVTEILMILAVFFCLVYWSRQNEELAGLLNGHLNTVTILIFSAGLVLGILSYLKAKFELTGTVLRGPFYFIAGQRKPQSSWFYSRAVFLLMIPATALATELLLLPVTVFETLLLVGSFCIGNIVSVGTIVCVFKPNMMLDQGRTKRLSLPGSTFAETAGAVSRLRKSMAPVVVERAFSKGAYGVSLWTKLCIINVIMILISPGFFTEDLAEGLPIWAALHGGINFIATIGNVTGLAVFLQPSGVSYPRFVWIVLGLPYLLSMATFALYAFLSPLAATHIPVISWAFSFGMLMIVVVYSGSFRIATRFDSPAIRGLKMFLDILLVLLAMSFFPPLIFAYALLRSFYYFLKGRWSYVL